ncbi:hypothetical protein J2Y49_002220 [Azospirillum sp. BE72]|nr:hypothetical protein [Azospirillum sp. BE72]
MIGHTPQKAPRMLTFLRRWLDARSDPGPLPCGTPFLMEAQRALLARTPLPRPPSERTDSVGGSHPADRDSCPHGAIELDGTHTR